MSVSKSTCEIYNVSKHGEYATICIDEWADDDNFCGEILINSSFGSFGYAWTECAIPFKQFLAGISYDAFMVKCIGYSAAYSFDGESSFDNLIRHIFALRKRKDITKQSARLLYNSFVHQEPRMIANFREFCDGFTEVVDEIPVNLQYQLNEPITYMVDMKNSQSSGFWDILWPEFVNHLKEKELSK